MDRSRVRPITFGVVGLLVVTAATAAAASPGDPWRLGVANTISAATSLSGAVANRLVGLTNTSTEAGARALTAVSRGSSSTLFAENQGTGTALQLRVAAGRPPLTVNSAAGKATNLNADRVDGLDSTQLQRPLTSGCADGTAVQSVTQAGVVSCEGKVTAAANADDADKVDGYDANQLARASGDFDNSLIVIDICSYTTIFSKTVTAPTSGVLLLNGTVAWRFHEDSAAGSTATLYSSFNISGPTLPEVGSSTTAGVPEANNTVIVAKAVSAGSHVVDLQVKECGTGKALLWNEAITTLFVPFNNAGSSGTGTLSLPEDAGGDRP
jgi:hypothetical protein